MDIDSVSITRFFGQSITLVKSGNDEYVIGAEIAKIFGKETFNMYRSLKNHGYRTYRITDKDIVEKIMVPRGMRSITLIPFDDIKMYLEYYYDDYAAHVLVSLVNKYSLKRKFRSEVFLELM